MLSTAQTTKNWMEDWLMKKDSEKTLTEVTVVSWYIIHTSVWKQQKDREANHKPPEHKSIAWLLEPTYFIPQLQDILKRYSINANKIKIITDVSHRSCVKEMNFIAVKLISIHMFVALTIHCPKSSNFFCVP